MTKQAKTTAPAAQAADTQPGTPAASGPGASTAGSILGIDIGGSGIKGALVDLRGGKLLTERFRIPTPAGASPEDVAEVVSEIAQHFEGQGGSGRGPIGVTFPGVVRGGITLSAANVDKRWIGLDADGLFTRAVGRPVTLLNDADAAGLAEAHYGAGKGVQGVVMLLTFGTGIGSALINSGVLVPNTELGHLELSGREVEPWASERARELEDLGLEDLEQARQRLPGAPGNAVQPGPIHHRGGHQQEGGEVAGAAEREDPGGARRPPERGGHRGRGAHGLAAARVNGPSHPGSV